MVPPGLRLALATFCADHALRALSALGYGTFANPQVEAGGIVAYGLHVRCTGTGSLPLSAQIRLQEEHLGAVYETVDETSKNLTEGGYGFVRGEAICDPTTSGHDYRIDGEIFAGKHHDFGISKEIHLPCNVN